MNATIWGRWVARLFQHPRRIRRSRSISRNLYCEHLEDRVTPTTFIWSGLGGNNNWSTPANWQGTVAPTTLANPDLVFNSVTPRLNTTNDISNLTVKSITLSSSNYSLNGSKLLLNGNVTVGAGATGERIGLDMQLTTASSFTINNVADLTVAGRLSGSSTLTKKGVGSMTLTNDNTVYTGAIDVQTGRLIMTNVGALGSTSAVTTVEANAQLQIAGVAAPIAEPLILNGPGTTNDGALFNATGNSTWTGTITMDSDASFGVAANTSLTVPGLITDTGFTGGHNLTKVGPGQLIFNRVGGNNYRGQTIINNGILTIRDPLSLGAGADATQPQSGSPQSGTTVNFNATTGEAGTLELAFTSLLSSDPNAILQDPTKPFDVLSNPVIGLQVFNDLLTLNGPGFNNVGALHNLSGSNIWNGGLTLGSPLPNTSDITIGIEANTQLTVSGVVGDDPNRSGPAIPALHKILPGKLIFDNANTYRGNTLIEEGILNVRDSQGLGSPVPGTGTVTVAPSGGNNTLAALEYEVDQGLDGTPQRTHNRNLGFDSVRKTGLWQEIVVPGTSGTFTVSFNGASTAPLAFNATAAQVQAALQGLPTIGSGNVIVTQDATVYRVTFANALSNTNVPLLSVTGTAGALVNNAYGLTVSKNLTLRGPGINSSGALHSISGLNVQAGTVTFSGASGSIGVDSDTRPGHPTADNSYFTSDYSLTVNTADALRSTTATKFLKFGTGQLILPVANTQLSGPTEIWGGWITVQNNNSLGLEVVDRSKGETVQPDSITVRGGAALHLLPLAGDLVIPNRLILAGQGITHPFAMLEQGALLSLKGNNRATGDIGLTTSLGGGPSAGASQVGIGVDDPVSTNPPGSSTLTTTGTISDFVPTAISITGLTASGGGDEQAFEFDTGGISGVIRITYDFLFVPDELRVYYPPRSQGGALIFDSGVINGAGTFTINYGPGTSTSVEIVMNEGGQDPGTFWIISDITITPNVPPGGNGILKMGSGLLSLQGDGSYTGPVSVQSGALRAQNDAALGRNSSGTAKDPTTQTYSQTKTTVAPGARLELSSTIPQTAGGFTAGVQMWDEQLVLNGAGQQVMVSGSAGTYTLSFNNQTTTPLTYNATASEMQAALNALSSVGGAGGTATVVQNGNVYTVTFGGTLAGLNNPLIVATAGPAPGNVTAIVSGSNFPLAVLGEDNLWRGPVTLATDTTIDIADHSRLTIYGTIDDDANPSPSGSNLTVGQVGTGDTGELVLSGNNTYRGTTNVKQGILTITNGKALGGIGGAEVQTVTIGGSSSGTFTLTFDGKTTAPIAAAATAVQIQAALNALSNIGGAASVTRVGNVVTITFGGALSGADQPTLSASGSGGTTTVVNTTTNGFGGTVVDMGAQMQIQGSLTVAGESLTLSGSGVSAADVPNGIPIRWNTIGASPINNAQTAGQNAATGRVTGIAVDPSDPNVIYLSSAGGGAWKTKNGGRTWTPLFDNTAAMFSGAIAVAPGDPRVIYLGTGEGNNSGDSFYGTGVYKSTDSGRTWNLVANSGSNLNPLMGSTISRIAVDPTNANLIYVSAGDGAVNSNAAPGTVGVWRFNGTSWLNLTSLVSGVRGTQVGQAPFNNAPVGTPGPDDDYRITFPQTNGAWSDLALVSKPGDSTRVLYAALGSWPGDPNNGVYRLINPQAVTGSNVQWLVGDPANPFKADNRSSNEFPTGASAGGIRNGIIRLTAVVTNPGNPILSPGPNALNVTVYASIVDPPSGALLEIQKTTDGGVTWAKTGATPPNYMSNQGDYDSAIIASPTNPNLVFAVGDVDFLPPTFFENQIVMSTDGGTTWTDISIDANGNGPHSDEHAAVIDSQGRLLVGNDGGIWRWDPAKALWTNLNGGGLAITTFNGITTSPIDPDFVLGGSQDNGTEKFTGDQAWQHVDDGDGGIVRFDLNDPNIAYHVLNGRLQKSTDGGNTWNTVLFVGGLYFPFLVDPISSRVLAGGSFPGLQESTDGGTTWTDLTAAIPTAPFTRVETFAIASYQGNRPDGTYQFDPGFPLVGDKGANTYDPDTIYVIDSSSFFSRRLFLTKDHAQSWADRTPSLPGLGQMIDVTVDPRNRDTVYVVTQGAPGSGGNRVLKSTDAGQNWTDITNNMIDIPGPSTDIPLWKTVIDPRDGTLYLGSDQGVWRLKNGSGSWDRFGAGMPNVQVKELDLNLNLNILTAGTYGRSAFQIHLDDPQADSGAVRATAGLTTWTGPIRLAADTTFGVGGSQSLQSGAAAATLDIIGVIGDTGAGNFHVTKDGQGTLIFSGKNTYGGLTEVANGVLGVNNPDALGAFRPGGDITAQGGTVVDAGAALQMQSDLEGEPIVLNGNGVAPGLNGHNSGALRNISGNNTYTGNLTLATNASIGVDSGSQLTIGTSPSLTGTGTIAGSPSLTKELTGTLVLASDDSGFTGPTTVIQGAVRLENAGALGTSGAGATVLDGGQIQLRTPTSGPNANQPVVVNAPLTLSGTGIFGSGALLNAGGNNSWNGPINFSILPGFSPNTFPFGTVSINVANPADTLTLGGPIAEFAPTGLTKIGPGELVLRAANGYSGATEVNQGIVDVRDAGALGSRLGTAAVQRIVTLKGGAFTLTFRGQSIGLNFGAAESQVKTALESLSTIGTGNIASVTRVEVQTTTQTGPGAPQTGFAYTVVFGGALANTQSQITASSQLGTASTSIVAVGGINVRVAAGAALELDSTGSSTPAGFTVAGHKLTMSGNGVGGHGALDNVVGNNGWTGPIELLTNSSIGAASTTALTLSGGIAGAGLDLTKVDPGTMIFPTGGNNQGRTVINAGTVEVNGSVGTVQLAGGALGGTGSVGAIGSNPGTGGTVSPGITFPAPAIGTLTGSSAILNSSNVVAVDLSNPGSPTNDVLQIVGSIDLGGASLSGTVAPNVGLGDIFTIITAGSVSGHFAGATTNPTVSGAISATIAFIDNQKFVVNYFADHVVLDRQLSNVTMGLAKTIAAPVYGQPEKFVATLTPESPNLQVSGTVIFTVIDPDSNNFQFQIPINPATGTATFDPSAAIPDGFGSPLQLGTYSVTASYNGLNSLDVVTFNPATAGPVQATVNKASTTTSVSSSQSPSMFGGTVTFTATVTSSVISPVGGTLPPNGTVTFRDTTTNTNLGTFALNPGSGVSSTATVSTSALAIGSHSIQATYNPAVGDNYLGSTSALFSQIVNKSSTTTAVAGSPNPSSYGQPVTLTGTVTGTGVGTPTGTLTFKLGSVILGTGALNASGVATYTTTAFQLPGGLGQVITAVYSSDGNFTSSTGTGTQDVNPVASTTSVTSSTNPSGFGQSVTFTATVTPSLSGGAVPTGPVTFILDGTITLGIGTLNTSGVATFNASGAQLSQGAHVITAQYAGSPNYAPSSGTVDQTVNVATSATTISASPAKGVAQRAITFTAHVVPSPSGSGVPTGQVIFTDQTAGGAVLGTATLDANGNALLVHHVGGTLGSHVIRASYQGDTNYAVSNGSTAVKIVANGTRMSTVTLKSSASTSNVGIPVTFTATVRDVGGSPVANPGGTVMFFDKSVLDPVTNKPVVLGYGQLVLISPGVMRATFTTSDLAQSQDFHQIRARYSGNGLFARSISAILNELIKPAPTRGSATTLAAPAGQDPADFGKTLSFTATVTDTGSGGSITPTGTVTFTDTTTNTVLATVDLTESSSGVAKATLSTNELDVGTHDIVATYNGDTDFAPPPAAGTTSNSITQSITQTTSSMTLTSSDLSSFVGQAVTFKATLTSGSGGGVPTGIVSFFDGSTLIGTGTIDATGVATFKTSTLAIGSHPIKAVYDGDTNFIGCNAPLPSNQVVTKSATTANLTRSTSDANTALTLTATIAPVPPGSGTPTGSVTFMIDGIDRGTVTLSGGVAVLVLPSGLAQGTHSIVVKYVGDANFNASNTGFSMIFGGRGG